MNDPGRGKVASMRQVANWFQAANDKSNPTIEAHIPVETSIAQAHTTPTNPDEAPKSRVMPA